ncbi:MAG: type II secretion system GspH family protein [bacterium]|nr:type II secretion system GspH family protein [bacterium]
MAFTLAETLITLLVIGVVAVLTIPSLMLQINEYTLAKQRAAFEKKFSEGLRQMRVDEKLSEKYATTEDFVNEMKKYFKISQVCNKENLHNCFTEEFVAFASTNNKVTAQKRFLTSNIRTSHSLVENMNYDSDVAGIIFADGVKMLLVTDPNCEGIESGNTTGNLYFCMGYIADVNGSKSPNIVGEDIVSNLPLIKNYGLNFEIMDNKVYMAGDCDAKNNCYRDVDGNYWQGAMNFCEAKGGSLPSQADIEDMLGIIYGGSFKNGMKTTSMVAAIADENSYRINNLEPVSSSTASMLYSLLNDGQGWGLWTDTSVQRSYYDFPEAYIFIFDDNGHAIQTWPYDLKHNNHKAICIK